MTMQRFTGPFVEGMRRAGANVGKQFQRIFDKPEPISEDELLKRVRFRDAVARMKSSADYQAFQTHIRTEIVKKTEELLDLEPTVFIGPVGLQMKGRIMGQRNVLDETIRVMNVGDEAEKTLKRRKEEANAR